MVHAVGFNETNLVFIETGILLLHSPGKSWTPATEKRIDQMQKGKYWIAVEPLSMVWIVAMLGRRRGLTCCLCTHVSSAAVLYCSNILESSPMIYRLCHMYLSHRIIESWRLESTSSDCLIQNPHLKAGSPRAAYSGPCFITLTVIKKKKYSYV